MKLRKKAMRGRGGTAGEGQVGMIKMAIHVYMKFSGRKNKGHRNKTVKIKAICWSPGKVGVCEFKEDWLGETER